MNFKNKKLWIGILVVVVVVFSFLVIFNHEDIKCYLWRNKIKIEIKQANYCSEDSDCENIFLGEGCFGCDVYLNTQEADRIEKMATEYGNSCGVGCLYECFEIKPVCKRGKCVGKD